MLRNNKISHKDPFKGSDVRVQDQQSNKQLKRYVPDEFKYVGEDSKRGGAVFIKKTNESFWQRFKIFWNTKK